MELLPNSVPLLLLLCSAADWQLAGVRVERRTLGPRLPPERFVPPLSRARSVQVFLLHGVFGMSTGRVVAFSLLLPREGGAVLSIEQLQDVSLVCLVVVGSLQVGLGSLACFLLNKTGGRYGLSVCAVGANLPLTGLASGSEQAGLLSALAPACSDCTSSPASASSGRDYRPVHCRTLGAGGGGAASPLLGLASTAASRMYPDGSAPPGPSGAGSILNSPASRWGSATDSWSHA